MKLSRIPGHEATVKHSFAFKQSTTALLQQYQALYSSVTGAEVSLKDVVEQMLLDFMADDKAFQKAIRQKQEATTAPVAVTAGDVQPAPKASVVPILADDDGSTEEFGLGAGQL